MARVTTIQHFSSIAELKQSFGTTLPKPHDWRLLPQGVVGAIHAIPTSQGVAIATNGILVAIIQETRLFIGHVEFFVPDEEETVVVDFKKASVTEKKQPQPRVDISEFI